MIHKFSQIGITTKARNFLNLLELKLHISIISLPAEMVIEFMIALGICCAQQKRIHNKSTMPSQTLTQDLKTNTKIESL
jgi:hypothetical protein